MEDGNALADGPRAHKPRRAWGACHGERGEALPASLMTVAGTSTTGTFPCCSADIFGSLNSLFSV